jgi:hypothetical protein
MKGRGHVSLIDCERQPDSLTNTPQSVNPEVVRTLEATADPSDRDNGRRKRESVFARREGIPDEGMGRTSPVRLATGFFLPQTMRTRDPNADSQGSSTPSIFTPTVYEDQLVPLPPRDRQRSTR